MDPLDYLVKDCWLHLFQFLTAKDKHSLCQTCTSFEAMLQPEKVKWAFELILPHVLKVKEFQDHNYWRLSSNLTLFSWRLVCKSWRIGFDNYCRTSDYGSVVHLRIFRKYNLCEFADLDKFVTVFKEHDGNPFIGRQVTIPATSIVEDQEEVKDQHERRHSARRERSLKKREMLMEFLSKYGKEIESLRLDACSYDSHYVTESCSQLDACKFLQFVLCSTPNLKSVIFALRAARAAEESADSFETALTKYFELNAFPEKPKLREINLQGTPPQMNTLILEAYGQHLRNLYAYNASDVSIDMWSKLKCLKMLKLFHSDFNYTVEILRALQSPLEILVYENSEVRTSDTFFAIDNFLLAIQHLPLKKVTVRPASKSLMESAPFPATFPRHPTLETLRLWILEAETISLDFLQFLPKLRSLVFNRTKIQLHSILRLTRGCSISN